MGSKGLRAHLKYVDQGHLSVKNVLQLISDLDVVQNQKYFFLILHNYFV